jgi:prolyl oligopeptidase
MKNSILLLCVLALFACNNSTKRKMISVNYPETKKVDTVDTYFGTEVKDPYRWLEDDMSEETANWVKAQNDVTFGYLGQIPFRSKIKERLEKLWNYERVGSPSKHGGYFYFSKNDGLQNQSVIYRKKDLNADDAEVFIDPNKFSEDGTISLAGMSFTQDGSLIAYQLSEGGSDWRKIIVKNTQTFETIGDTLIDVKFSGVSWKGNEGFYYSSYDKPKGSQLTAKTQYHKLYYHKLGTPQKNDMLVFGGEKQPKRYIWGTVTEDQKYLVISAAESTKGNELYIQDLSKTGNKIIQVVQGFETNNSYVDNEGSRFLLHTNLNAPNNRLVEFDFSKPTPENWKDLITETKDVMEVSTAGGSLFANYMVDVKTQVMQYDYTGKLIREVELPSVGTAGGFYAKKEEAELYYVFTSFTYPSTIFKYTISEGKSELYWKPGLDFNPTDYETEQVFYTSKDGTKYPCSLSIKKD